MKTPKWIAALGLVLCAGCGYEPPPQAPSAQEPHPRYVNVEPEGPVPFEAVARYDVDPGPNDYGANGFLATCGTPVKVKDSTGRIVHGRLILFGLQSGGQGPAGRGDYLVEVPDSYINAARDGRRSVAFEFYKVPETVSNSGKTAAWVIFMSETPLACSG